MGLGRTLTVLSLGTVAALAAALLAPEAKAERIKLKNGHEIKECWILEESKAEIVIAVIRQGNIGKITLDPSTVAEIDRNRELSIEEALVKARKALEEEARKREEERARAAAIAASAATRTAQPASGTTSGAGRTSGGGASTSSVQPGSRLANLVGPTTPEEEEKIDKAIDGIGDTRNQGGAATRRQNALRELISMGPKAITAINKALGDEVSYRKGNAALAVVEIAKADGRLGIYEETVPALIKLLYAPQPWLRANANHALESIAGQSMGYPAETPTGDEPGPGELATIDKWGKWWEAQKIVLSAQ